MLKAILNGKAGHISLDNGSSQSWREVFRRREDLLTAVFFGRLQYLSESGTQNVLSLLIGVESAQSVGEIHEIVFWPKLDVTDLGKRCFVEPDLLILCESAALLIEVKPPFGGMQSTEQWRNEIESLVQQFDKDDSEYDIPDVIHFIALGHNSIDWRGEAAKLEIDYAEQSLRIHTVEWEEVNHGITQLNDIETGRDQAIFLDWLEAFTLFGMIERPLPFSDLLKLNGSITASWDKFFSSQSLQTDVFEDWSPLVQFIYKHQLDITQTGLCQPRHQRQIIVVANSSAAGQQ